MKDLQRITVLTFISLFAFACSQENEASYIDEVALENYEGDESYEPDGSYAEEKSEVYNEQQIANSSNFVNSNAHEEITVPDFTKKGTYTWSEKDQSYVKAEKDYKKVVSSEGLTNPYKDKKFIKTANLEFLVKDVYNSSVAIEEIVIANDGFLINSNLYTEIYRSQIFEKTKEVNVLVEEFETRNNITIRVPSQNLHETLMKIADEIEFLQFRSITADDVGLKLLAEELEQKRNAKSASNIQKQINTGGKLDDKIYGEEIAFQRETQKDISKLKELSIEDKIEYSTVTIAIYQGKEMRTEDFANFDIFKNQYKKPFSRELVDSFSSSIEIIKVFIAFCVTIWPFLVLGFVGFFFLKRRFGKKIKE